VVEPMSYKWLVRGNFWMNARSDSVVDVDVLDDMVMYESVMYEYCIEI
jgi:hypothetical protein